MHDRRDAPARVTQSGGVADIGSDDLVLVGRALHPLDVEEPQHEVLAEQGDDPAPDPDSRPP